MVDRTSATFPYGVCGGAAGTNESKFSYHNHDLGAPYSYCTRSRTGGSHVAGEASEMSHTGYTPSPDTGLPTLDPFLWENGTMQHLGSLCGTPTFVGLNKCGSVIRQSFLPGDVDYGHFSEVDLLLREDGCRQVHSRKTVGP